MIYLIDIESVETRYTKQWKTHFPQLLRDNGLDVTVIEGPTDIPEATTPGAFLNFGGTNIYKSVQLEKIARLINDGTVKDGDYFLYADAWNPTVIQLKYMVELLGIDVRIGGLWHAGSYDPQDFLGRLIGNEDWVRNAERSMFYCYDDNFFATQFHVELFAESFKTDLSVSVVGWPMEYVENDLQPYKNMEKKDIILFPHRMAPEKQPEVFDYIASQMPQYEFIKCQELDLTKDEYHKLLGEAKMVFSANLQETLGISVYEGAIVDAIPMMPDRLSYSEMWNNDFLYPSEWTESLESTKRHINDIMAYIDLTMIEYDTFRDSLQQQVIDLREFFYADNLIDSIR